MVHHFTLLWFISRLDKPLWNYSSKLLTMAKDQIDQLKKGHVLVFPYPLQGHINPMLQFSKRLQNKGVKVTIVTTSSFFKNIADASSLSFPIETISDGFDAEPAEKPISIEQYMTSFEEIGPLTLGKLLEKLVNSGNKVDCIVYDAIVPWALDVGKKYGVLGAAFFTQSCAVANIYYHVYKGVIKEKKKEDHDDDKEDIVRIPGLPPLKASDLPSFVTRPQLYPAILELVYNQFRNIHMADWVFFNTIYKLEEEVIDWLTKLWKVRPIGPTIPSMYLDKRLLDDKVYSLSVFKPASDECIHWLKQRKLNSVVYVSFGSMASLDGEAMAELAWGIKSTGYYFLWVVRSSEKENLPMNFIEETTEQGLVVTWCPQLEVLANESIGCFVTHSGWNSTLEAMALGVPMVVMPQWTDQNTNAKYVMDVWKIGVRAQPDGNGVVRKEVIRNCIMEVMDGERGEEIKRNSIKWKELAKEAMDEGGSSDKNVEEFVSKLAHTYSKDDIYITDGNQEKNSDEFGSELSNGGMSNTGGNSEKKQP